MSDTMICQECGQNEANVHIIKSVDGEKTELFLCEQCARSKEELEFSSESKYSLHELFSSILNQHLLGSREARNAAKLQCPSCGLSFAQFSQIGRIGCSECFYAFEERLKPLLQRIHTGTAHTGKVPARAQSRVRYLRERDQLKEQLQEKIQNEEFEEAARLRDRIRNLEKELAKEEESLEENSDEENKKDQDGKGE